MRTKAEVAKLRRTVWDHYAAHARAMPWRQNPTAYWVVVSELMLQQTQVGRVLPKFQAFVAEFPDFASLAVAPFSQVLGLWVGLGYNRRAKFLHDAAREVMERYNGRLPTTVEDLVSLPGVGPNTAGAIAAYAFNQPVVFVETNIRTVMLHHFFAGNHQVSETSIKAAASAVLDTSRPREWYWAVMDYGTHLKKMHGNNIHRAKAYKRQSAFQGSLRQVRGKVVAVLAQAPHSLGDLEVVVADQRLPQVMAALQAEKLIIRQGNRVQLAE